jgi:hypothetical protein
MRFVCLQVPESAVSYFLSEMSVQLRPAAHAVLDTLVLLFLPQALIVQDGPLASLFGVS